VAPIMAVALGVLALGLGLANVALDLRTHQPVAWLSDWHRDLPMAVPRWAAAAGAMAAYGRRPDRGRVLLCAGSVVRRPIS
jgi:ABC-type Fe3+ transport system permease subunit